MLEYLVTYNSSVTTIYMEFIADIEFQPHLFIFGEIFIQQKQVNNFQYLCLNFSSST